MKYNIEAIRLMLIFSDVLDNSSECRKNNVKFYIFISIFSFKLLIFLNPNFFLNF